MACPLSKCALPGTVLSFAMAALLALSPSGVAIAEEISSTITSNGLTVEFAARAATQGEANDKIVAGQDIEVRFKVTDAVTGTAVSNTNPGVWIDGQEENRRRPAEIRRGPGHMSGEDWILSPARSDLPGGH